eukprot:m.32387 g.32387  ORF g.32387 m.32387 type:complete len:816 (-) comp6381_c0_seq1:2700-5147(-)
MGQNQTSLLLHEAFNGFLAEEGSISIQDEQFWTKFYPTENVSYVEFTRLITAENVRKLRSKNPDNLKTFIRRAICTLSHHTNSGGVNGFASQFQVTNLIRILTRLMPLIFEDHEWDEFWLTPTPVGLTITLPEKALAPVSMHGAPANMREKLQAEQDQALKDAQPPTNPSPPLYQTLLVALLDLMFAPGYTVHQKKLRSIPHGTEAPQGTRPPAIIDAENLVWYTGIQTETTFEERPSLVMHQVDTIRLLIACLSRPLYQQPNGFDIRWDPFAAYIVGGYHRHSVPLILSLFNAVLSYDPVGFGLPFNYLVVPMKNREDLMEMCGQLVCFLLDFVPYPTSNDDEDVQHGVNFFIDWVDSLKNDKDFEFIADQMTMLLENPLQSYYIPLSYKSINCHQEILIMFWRLCETNKSFVSYLMKSGKVLGILMPLLFRLNEAKEDEGDFGLVQVCIYSLLLLSGQRNFSVHLNEEWDGHIAFDGIPFSNGNYADLLFMVVHNVLVADNPRLSPFYELLLTIIVNIAPFIKRVSLEAANKLVHLFRVFSSPRYIFASEANHRLVFFLLEAFNSLIQYQFEGNQHFVYCIIRVRDLFTKLEGLSIDQAALLSTAESEEKEEKDGEEEKNEEEEDEDVPDSDEDLAVDVSQQKIPNYPISEHESGTLGVVVPSQEPGSPHAKKMIVNTPVRMDTSEHPNVPSSSTFVPTQEWFDTWFSNLPLKTIIRLLKVLVPQVEDLCVKRGVTHEIEIVEFLKKGTLVGLLPVPHQIITRRYQGVGRSSAWFTSYMWSIIFLKNISNPNLVDSNITLFEVKVTHGTNTTD